MPKNIKTKQGFTIIEVVLVLAVAGLIFLMVFIALPSLQRTQRDTQRRQDMSRLSAALVQYQTNNSNKADNLPGKGTYAPGDSVTFDSSCDSSTACKFVKNYMNAANAEQNLFLDPDGAPYQVGITANLATGSSTDLTTIEIGSGSDKTTLTYNGTSKTYTISASNFEDHAVFIVPGGKCSNEADGENVIEQAQRRHYAVIMKLEGSGYACLDNQ